MPKDTQNESDSPSDECTVAGVEFIEVFEMGEYPYGAGWALEEDELDTDKDLVAHFGEVDDFEDIPWPGEVYLRVCLNEVVVPKDNIKSVNQEIYDGSHFAYGQLRISLEDTKFTVVDDIAVGGSSPVDSFTADDFDGRHRGDN